VECHHLAELALRHRDIFVVGEEQRVDVRKLLTGFNEELHELFIRVLRVGLVLLRMLGSPQTVAEQDGEVHVV